MNTTKTTDTRKPLWEVAADATLSVKWEVEKAGYRLGDKALEKISSTIRGNIYASNLRNETNKGIPERVLIPSASEADLLRTEMASRQLTCERCGNKTDGGAWLGFVYVGAECLTNEDREYLE